MLVLRISLGGGELWYYLGSPHLRGRGIGSELVKVLMEYGKEHCSLTWFYARVSHSNMASQKVLEKCGLVCVAEEFDSDFQDCMLRYEYGCRRVGP